MITLLFRAVCNKFIRLLLFVGMLPIPYPAIITAFEFDSTSSIARKFKVGEIVIKLIDLSRSVYSLSSPVFGGSILSHNISKFTPK